MSAASQKPPSSAFVRGLLQERDGLRALVARAAKRIRHDHAYPMDVFSEENPHHCAGCDLENELLRAALTTTDEETTR